MVYVTSLLLLLCESVTACAALTRTKSGTHVEKSCLGQNNTHASSWAHNSSSSPPPSVAAPPFRQMPVRHPHTSSRISVYTFSHGMRPFSSKIRCCVHEKVSLFSHACSCMRPCGHMHVPLALQLEVGSRKLSRLQCAHSDVNPRARDADVGMHTLSRSLSTQTGHRAISVNGYPR